MLWIVNTCVMSFGAGIYAACIFLSDAPIPATLVSGLILQLLATITLAWRVYARMPPAAAE